MNEAPVVSQAERAVRLLLYAGVGLAVLGVITVYLGYNGAATNTSVVQQFPYLLSGGVIGLSLVVAGGCIGLSSVLLASRVSLHSEIAELRSSVEALGESIAHSSIGQHNGSANGGSFGSLVAVSRGGSSFHRSECRLVAARVDTRPMPREDAEGRGLLACRICKP